jgi:hypothetical protein
VNTPRLPFGGRTHPSKGLGWGEVSPLVPALCASTTPLSGGHPRNAPGHLPPPAVEALGRVVGGTTIGPPTGGQNYAVHGDPRKRGFGGRTLSKPVKRKRRFAQRPRTDALPKHLVEVPHTYGVPRPGPEARSRTRRAVGAHPRRMWGEVSHCQQLKNFGPRMARISAIGVTNNTYPCALRAN